MHIGIVRRGWSGTGGAEAYLLRLAAALQAEGQRLTLFGSGACPPEWEHGWVRLAGRSPMEFARAFARERTKGLAGCDLIFSMERVPGCDVFRAGDGVHAAWLERRKSKSPWWKKWSLRWNPKHRQLLRLEAEIFSKDSRTYCIANSELVAQELERFYGVGKERVRVIRNGFDRPRVSRVVEEEERRRYWRGVWGIGPEERVVFFVGSGWERKGLGAAVDAVGRVPHLRLVVAGRGPVAKYGGKQVLHLGVVANLSDLWPAADFMIHPTLYDPFSNACLEGLAWGLPVITTRDNGFAELVQEGCTGTILTSTWAAEALEEALRFWMDRTGGEGSRALRRACEEAAKPWTVERNCRETCEVLQKLLEGVDQSRTRLLKA